jgi:hypothetical protein
MTVSAIPRRTASSPKRVDHDFVQAALVRVAVEALARGEVPALRFGVARVRGKEHERRTAIHRHGVAGALLDDGGDGLSKGGQPALAVHGGGVAHVL